MGCAVCEPIGRAFGLAGGQRLNLVQARLNDGERDALDALRRKTGLSDSDLVRTALEDMARSLEGPPAFALRLSA